MGTESFVCLFTVVLIFFFAFLFFFHIMASLAQFWLSANKFSIGQPLLPRAERCSGSIKIARASFKTPKFPGPKIISRKFD